MSRFPLYHWHFEISTKCALECPRCPRTLYPGQYNVGQMDLGQIQKICSQPEFINEALKVTFCGGQGDPIYNSQFLEIVAYIKSIRPEIILTIVTNGSHRSHEFWLKLRSLLRTGDDIVFSVDGYDHESNNKYRTGSRWDSIWSAMKIMANGPALVIWNAIYFKFNADHISKMMGMASGLGLDGFRLTKSSLFGSRNAGFIDPGLGYDPLEPDANQISEIERMYKDMTWLDPKSDRMKSMGRRYQEFDRKRGQLMRELWSRTENQRVFPNCQFGFRGVYVDVDGYFYPCSWVSHPLPHYPENSFRKLFFEKRKQELDLKQNSLSEVISSSVWNDLGRTWHSPDQRITLECGQKCERAHFPIGNYEKLMRQTEASAP